jgi:Tol biopolymer transport system component
MALSPGTRLGPYSIVDPLGEGGMGEVYRARDTRLGRDVAVKVLSGEVSERPDARARFESEAKTISRLSHPHICALYDVGREGTTEYLVMELLEGGTLAERIARGPLPIAEVLRIGIQVADALEGAHRSGIVHRDVKPANVMLTRSGAKLMDFGLARAGVLPPLAGLGGSGSRDPGESPTLVAPSAPEGSIVGTLAYLAPEQLEGREADARSDLWGLGCVLYEMTTGQRPFASRKPAPLIAAIMEREPPPLGGVVPGVPPGFERAVMRCLSKDPDERWQSARDLRSELQWIADGGSQMDLRPVGLPRRAARPRPGWLLTGTLALAVVGLAVALALRPRTGAETFRFRQVNVRREAIFQAAFSRTGDAIVYSASTEGNTPRLYTVGPEYPEPRAIGAPGMHLLAASSRGELAVLLGARYIWHRTFVGTLARLPLGGGAPREILEGVRQADWSSDGRELAVIREVGGVDRLEYPIGRVLHEASGYMTDVRVSPRGDRIAYFEHPRKWDDRGSVNVVDREGRSTVLSDGYWSARGLAWSPDGREVLFSASLEGGGYIVYGVTLDGKRRLAYQAPGGLLLQDVAKDGRWLVVRPDFRYAAMVGATGAGPDRDLSWLNTSHARAISPDGRTLLFAETGLGPQYAVCIRGTDGSPVVRLGEGWPADLSHDGRFVLAVVQSHPQQLVAYPTGAGGTRHYERGGIESYAGAEWFPDGGRILVNGNERGRGTRVFVQAADGGPPRPVTPEGTREGRLSADGRLVLARAPEAGYRLYPLDGGEAREAPGLADDDLVAHWSEDGRWVLAYRRADIPCHLDRVFLDSGRREPFAEVAPPDRTGLLSLRGLVFTHDMRSYAYTAYYQVSSLFVSEPAER